jgi:predicted secreted protein
MRAGLRQAAIVLLSFAAPEPAFAGNGSALNVIGFSPDGRYFAFEQYGEAGPAMVYASITAMEVTSDKIVKGTPAIASFNLDASDRSLDARRKLLAQARVKASQEAASLLRIIQISEAGLPIGAIAKSRARQTLDAEAVKSVREEAIRTLSLPEQGFGPNSELVLKEFDIAMPRCSNPRGEGHPNGFALTLERKGRPTIHLSRDQTIPAWRGCPNRYGLSEVHVLPLPDGTISLATLIQFFNVTAEGTDRRFLAVTGRIR